MHSTKVLRAHFSIKSMLSKNCMLEEGCQQAHISFEISSRVK